MIGNIASLASHIPIARPTSRLDDLLTFYCDGLGLARIDGVQHHSRYSGVMVGLPDSHLHIEFTTHHDHARHPLGLAPTSDNLLAFYLPGPDTLSVFTERLTDRSHPAVEPENPYWLDLGAVTFEDPDRWRVVPVPSAYS